MRSTGHDLFSLLGDLNALFSQDKFNAKRIYKTKAALVTEQLSQIFINKATNNKHQASKKNK
jgi:hypothetical protein